MNKEILEGNKLIAEFVTEEPEVLRRDLKRAGTLESMQYHESWDWLMPVIEKIEKNTSYELTTSYDKRFEFIGWSVHWFTLKASDEILGYIEDKRFNTKINAAWYAMVEFIKWYNENNNILRDDK